MLLPYIEVKDMVDLQLSPLGGIMQPEGCPRGVIVNYSFYYINANMFKLGPEAVMQFGKAIERLLKQAVQTHPRFGPLLHYKVKILDGFLPFTIHICSKEIWGVFLPTFLGLPPLVAFPLVLPMGWTYYSPPFFCVFTETIFDLTNKELNKNVRHLEHLLEDTARKLDCLRTVKQTWACQSQRLKTTGCEKRHYY
jgi:hypothetical protein